MLGAQSHRIELRRTPARSTQLQLGPAPGMPWFALRFASALQLPSRFARASNALAGSAGVSICRPAKSSNPQSSSAPSVTTSMSPRNRSRKAPLLNRTNTDSS